MNKADILPGMRIREDVGDLNPLAQSISEIGLLHPVVVRSDGTLIAGMRRFLAMTDVLGWTDIPVRVVTNLDDAVMALRAEGDENAQRKDLTPNESVKLGELLEPLEREAAHRRQSTLNGKGHASENFTQATTARALDNVAAAVGMSRPTYEKAKEVVQAAEENPELYADLAEKMHATGKVDGVHKRLTERRKQEELTAMARKGEDAPDLPNARVLHGDFYEVMKTFADASMDVVITDPPYLLEYIHLYEELAAQSKRVLKPGGSLLVMCGQYHLPEVMRLLCMHMRYHWTVAYMTPGQSTQIWPRKVMPFWKPVIWLVNGEYVGEWVGDVCTSAENDKSLHQWGQSVSGMLDIVQRFTTLGQVVLDPFCGACTTGVAALQLGRKFIGIDKDIKHVNVARSRLSEYARLEAA